MTPVQIAALAYSLGVFLGWSFGIPTTWSLPIIFLGLCALAVPIKPRFPKHFLLFCSLGILMISFFQQGVDDVKYSDSQYLVSGNVVGIEEASSSKTVFDLQISQSSPPELTGKIRIYAPPIKDIEISDYLAIKGRPYSAKKARNPGQFNFTQYLATQKFTTLFYTDKEPETIEKSSNFLLYVGPKMRNLSFQVFSEALPERYALMLDSLVYGRSNIPDDMFTAFQKAGTMHILAASGFNVTIMAFSTLLLLMWITGHRKASIIGAIIISLIYAAAAGFSPTVARAVIMVIFSMSAGLFSRKYSASSGLAFAVLILLLFNPNWLFDVGFQLSFVSTLGFFIVSPTIFSRVVSTKWYSKIVFIFIQTIIIQILTLPILSHHFYEFSIISPVSNLIAIPMAELIVPMGVVAGLVGIIIRPVGIMISWVIWPMLVLLDKILIFLSSFNWAMFVTGLLPVAIWIPYYLGLLGIYMHILKPKLISLPRLKTFSLVCAVVFVSFTIGTFSGFATCKTPMVVFLDVGQGDAIFVVTATGKTMLVDCAGAKYGKSFNPGRNIVAPFLKSQGVSKLDYVIATHNDSDHIGGMPAVLSQMRFDKVYVSKIKNDTFQSIDLEKIVAKASPVVPKPGEIINIDEETTLEFFGPIDRLLGEDDSQRINNGSIVFKLTLQGVSFLLTGDMQNEAMEYHVKNKFDIKSDILKLPHHGGYAKSMSEWVAKISPKIAVNSDSATEGTGADLRTEEALRNLKVPIISTADNGAVIFVIKDGGYKIETFVK